MTLLLPVEIKLRDLAKLIFPEKKKPVLHHQVGSNPVDIDEPFWRYHLERAEPADAWLIE